MSQDPLDAETPPTRGRLVRVLAVYVVAAVAAVEGVDVFAGALHLPDAVVTLVAILAVAGLPVTIGGHWVWTRGADWPVRRIAAGWRAGLYASGAIGALVLTTAAWWALEREGAAPVAEALVPDGGEGIAVLPFSTRGSERIAYLGEGMVYLLGAKLDGVGGLRRLDPEVLLRQAAAGDSPEIAAASLGAAYYVTGGVVEAGRAIQITASLHDLRLGTSVSAEAVAESEDDLMGALDRLAARLLAVQAQTPAGRLTRLAALTTDSLEALKRYLEGERRWRAGDLGGAEEELARAVSIDSTFALGHYRLAIMREWAADYRGAREASAAALRHADRLSGLDRAMVEALERWEAASPAEAERLYEEVLTVRPDNVEAAYWLGETLLHYNPQRGRPVVEAKGPLERVLALDPHHIGALFHRVELALRAGNRAEMDSVARVFLEAVPGDPYHAMIRALWQAYTGNEGGLHAAARALAGSPYDAGSVVLLYLCAPDVEERDLFAAADVLRGDRQPREVQATGFAFRAALQIERGRLAAARAEVASAEAAHPGTGASVRGFIAALPFLPPDSALEDRGALESWDAESSAPSSTASFVIATAEEDLLPDIQRLALGHLSARSDPAGALRRAEELETPDGDDRRDRVRRSFAASVRARVYLQQGEPDRAVGVLAAAPFAAEYPWMMFSPWLGQGLDRWLRAEALRASGRLEEARVWYAAAAEPVSALDRSFIAPSHLRRAQLLEQLGDPESARRHYTRFIEMWHDADPELRPLVEEAEARLALLPGGG